MIWAICAAIRLPNQSFAILPGPGLTQPPLNLQADEMLSGVVERLLKALNQIDRKMSGNSSPVPTRKRRLNRSLLLLTENSPVADFHG
jgi:hypothetical protein